MVVNYTGPNGGLWNVGANWTGGLAPVIGDDVTLGNNTSSAVLGLTYNTTVGGAGFNTLVINAATASTFTLTQSGAATTMIAQTLTLGTTTFGAIYDQSNGAASFTTMSIGTGSGGQGIYQLSNLGSLGVGTLNLGGASTSNGGNRLNQTGGTATVTSVLTIGTLNTTGAYNLSGGTLNVTGGTGMRVGFGGAGTFNHTNGTVNMGANPIYLGSSAGGTGTYNLSGQLNSRYVGLSGYSTSVFSQTGGTHTIGASGNGFLEIGDSAATKSAAYNLSGGTLQVNGNIQVTGTQTVGGNSARLNVSSGTATATGTLTIGATTGLNGGVTMSGTGQLNVNSLNVGSSGANSFTLSAGTFSTTQSATFTSLAGGVTNYTQTTGTAGTGSNFTVTGAGAASASIQGGSLNAASQIIVSAVNSGTASIDVSGAGTTVTAPVLFLGFFAGGTSNDFNQSGGTVTLSSGATVGVTSTPSTYSLSGTGAFNPNTLSVGNNFSGGGNGTIQQSGGTLTTSSLILGRNAGDTGNYVLSGGTLTGSGGPLTLGGNVGFFGTGTFTQTGGAASFGGLLIGAGAGSNGTYNLGGTGVLDASLTQVGGTGGTGAINQTGGTHTATVTILQGSSYALSGGTLTVPNVATGLSIRGLFNMSGGTQNGGVRNEGSFIYSGGTFNGSLQNNATASFLASFNAGLGLRNNGSITVNPLISLSVSAAQTFDNSGSLTLVGGQLSGAGAIVNNATISGFGTIGGTGGFTNNALITGSGGNLIFGNTTSINNGNLSVASGLQLQLNGGSFTNNGTLNLNSGAVSGTAALTNAAGGSIFGPGLIATPFTNSGAVGVTSGTLNVAGGWTNNGVVTLGGLTASIAGGALNNPGTIQGFGSLSANVNNLNNGTIEAIGGTLTLSSAGVSNNVGGTLAASTGSQLLLKQGASNAGTIALAGGTVDTSGFGLPNSGQITGFGLLRTGGINNTGKVLLAGGSSNVYGAITGLTGSLLAVSGNSSATFYGSIDIKSGAELRVSAGSVATFFGSVAQRTGSTFSGTGTKFYEGGLSVGGSPGLGTDSGDVSFGSGNLYLAEIGGITACTADCATNELLKNNGFDRYVVAGHLGLGGTLKIVSWNGFVGQAGEQFDLLDWGSVSGGFTAVDASGLLLASGTALDLSQLGTTGTISVVAVPEPGAWALMLLGLMGLAGAKSARGRGQGQAEEDRG